MQRKSKEKTEKKKTKSESHWRGLGGVVVECAKRGQTLVKSKRNITHKTVTKRQWQATQR